MTKGFLKRYLTVLANNKLNPYFAQTTQNLSYNNIARLLKVCSYCWHGDGSFQKAPSTIFITLFDD